jgi:hypothetical protein
MYLHRPIDPIWSQETQFPSQATLQQTLSTQKPERHSPPFAQSEPLAF